MIEKPKRNLPRFGRSGGSFGLSAEAVPYRDQDDRDALKKRRIIADLRQGETTKHAETAGHGEGGFNEIESSHHLFFCNTVWWQRFSPQKTCGTGKSLSPIGCSNTSSIFQFHFAHDLFLDSFHTRRGHPPPSLSGYRRFLGSRFWSKSACEICDATPPSGTGHLASQTMAFSTTFL